MDKYTNRGIQEIPSLEPKWVEFIYFRLRRSCVYAGEKYSKISSLVNKLTVERLTYQSPKSQKKQSSANQLIKSWETEDLVERREEKIESPRDCCLDELRRQDTVWENGTSTASLLKAIPSCFRRSLCFFFFFFFFFQTLVFCAKEKQKKKREKEEREEIGKEHV